MADKRLKEILKRWVFRFAFHVSIWRLNAIKILRGQIKTGLSHWFYVLYNYADFLVVKNKGLYILQWNSTNQKEAGIVVKQTVAGPSKAWGAAVTSKR